MITSLSQSRITVKRKSAKIAEAQALASSTDLSVSADISSAVQVVFTNSVSGVVTITGTKGGLSQSEDITLSSNTVAISTNLFDTITNIAMDSTLVSAGGNFTPKFSGSEGGDSSVLSTIVTGWPMRLVRGKPKWYAEPEMGSSELEIFYALLDHSLVWEPKTGDIFINDDTSEQYIVLGNPVYEGIGYGKHWNVRLSKRSNSS